MQVGYVPYRWLRALRLENRTVTKPTQQAISQPVEFYHPYPFLYIIHPSDNIAEMGTPFITLGQGFNRNWQAYIVPVKRDDMSLGAQLVRIFPFFTGRMIENNTLVNNWANGWNLKSLEEEIVSSGNGQDIPSIIIVFWPQYLGFLGYGLVFVGFAYIILFYSRLSPSEHNHRPHKPHRGNNYTHLPDHVVKK
jgi:hypothetical protein